MTKGAVAVFSSGQGTPMSSDFTERPRGEFKGVDLGDGDGPAAIVDAVQQARRKRAEECPRLLPTSLYAATRSLIAPLPGL